jgi:hypothetical protein
LTNNLLSFDFDWRSWFGTTLMGDGKLRDMLYTPVCVVPTDPFADPSKWVSFNGRMDKISTLMEQVLKDNGLLLTVSLWLPGDPQPVGFARSFKVATLVVGLQGPLRYHGSDEIFHRRHHHRSC